MRKIIFALLLLSLPGMAFCQTKKPKKRDTVKTEDKVEKLLVVNFSKLFKEESNGDFTAMFPIKINYYTIEQGGSFPLGGSIGGVMLQTIKGHNLLIDTVKGVIIYKGVFK